MTVRRKASRSVQRPPVSRPGVLITGASGGIGRAISVAFAEAGWFVGVHYHRGKAAAETTLRQVCQAGGGGALYQADVRDSVAVAQMVEAFCREDVQAAALICNAGIGSGSLLLRQREEERDDVIATDLTGVFHCLRAMAPVFLSGGGGGIVVIGSYAGIQGGAGQAAYAAAKAGLIGLVRTAALEWGAGNVRVNLVLPGWQQTALSCDVMPVAAGFSDHALRRPPSMIDVARTVVHLVQQSGVSGQMWNCDSRKL